MFSAVLVLLLASCSSWSSGAKSGEGEGCKSDSVCQAGLVCRSLVCVSNTPADGDHDGEQDLMERETDTDVLEGETSEGDGEQDTSEPIEKVGKKALIIVDRTIWRTNGTPGEVAKVIELPCYPREMRNIGDFVLFKCKTTTTVSLWRTDGTAGGTKKVYDFKDIFENGEDTTLADWATAFRGNDYFSFSGRLLGKDEKTVALFKSDGTPEGTVVLGYFGEEPYQFREGGGQLAFFARKDTTANWGLWSTDGTAKGTYEIGQRSDQTADLNAQSQGEDSQLFFLNGRFFFFASSDETGRELWASDADMKGVNLFLDINQGKLQSRQKTVSYDTVIFESQAFFAARTVSNGLEPWTTDGTVEGTKLVADLGPVSEASPADLSLDSTPHSFTLCQGKLYFAARFPMYGLDQAVYSMSSVLELPQKIAVMEGNGIRAMACVGQTLYVVTQGEYWQETLSVLNGAGNALEVINPLVAQKSVPITLYPTAERMYFYMDTKEYGRTLWVSDGTKESTVLLVDFDQLPGATKEYLDNFIPYEWQEQEAGKAAQTNFL